jgi:hypothetical protein
VIMPTDIVRTKEILVDFYHAVFGSPAVPTFLRTSDRGYISVPGLKANMVRRNMPNSLATAKGHLDRLRQNLRSTVFGKKQQKKLRWMRSLILCVSQTAHH